MKVFKTIEEIKKVYGDKVDVVEGESVWVVSDGQGIKASVFFLPKPLQKEKIAEIMIANGFPPKYLKVALNGVKETKCIKKVKELRKNGIILDGPPGIGKSIASTWKAAKLLQAREISNPLYISCISFPDLKSLYATYKNYDCFMIDDLITSLPQARLDFIIELIYHAELEEKYIFITTNAFQNVATMFPEAILSRLRGYCEWHKIEEKEDLRLSQ